MALVRFGSCGAVQPDIAVGTVCVCEQGCTLITQNPDAYGHDAPEGELKFRMHRVVKPHAGMTELLLNELQSELGEVMARSCMNATTDSFYSSQGRLDDNFGDDNFEVVQAAIKQFPTLGTLEVTLLHRTDSTPYTTFITGTTTVCSVAEELEFYCNLGNALLSEVALSVDMNPRLSTEPILVSAAAMALANRHTGAVIDAADIQSLEARGGAAVLRAITTVQLDG
eukprot:21508-Heterococcus_DN1.PRE.4